MTTWSAGTGASSGTSTPASNCRSQRASGVGGPSGRGERIAGVEDDRAAELHVSGDLGDGLLRRLRSAGHDRPVEQG